MATVNVDKPSIALRPPSTMMKLARMGSMHQTRLSFMRVLLRRFAAEQWSFKRTLWQMDNKGVGVGVYSATGPDRTYSLVVFSNDLDPSKRSDRVIAEEWDSTFTLFDGVPNDADIKRLQQNVPLQEAGRISASELSLSRANRSVRLFNYVRETLAQGLQPEAAELNKVGYLMRTTAVYGSGKFGAIDRRFIAGREEFTSPFQSELMAVYMIRMFSVDIVEHLAKVDSPATAVTLNKNLRRSLGIGNSTGLGMAPFIVNHPVLFNQWMLSREQALYRVREVATCDLETVERFCVLLERQQAGLKYWISEHPLQQEKIAALRADLASLNSKVLPRELSPQVYPWNTLYLWAEHNLSLEGQECLVTLLIELYPHLVDELAANMSADEDQYFKIDGKMKIGSIAELINTHYQFALNTDFTDRDANARFWYASEEKLEPRVGERFDEPGAEREHPLAIARDVVGIYKDIQQSDPNDVVALFLINHPEHRLVVRRIQQAALHPYSEIEDNLLSNKMLPIDLLRCKLSFFGAIKFDPRSDRWVRINMFQHAPLPDELLNTYDDTWVYPPADSGAELVQEPIH